MSDCCAAASVIFDSFVSVCKELGVLSFCFISGWEGVLKSLTCIYTERYKRLSSEETVLKSQ